MNKSNKGCECFDIPDTPMSSELVKRVLRKKKPNLEKAIICLVCIIVIYFICKYPIHILWYLSRTVGR